MEEWRDIEGYEGLYQVSNEGRVKSLAKEWICGKGTKRHKDESIMKHNITKLGYHRIMLVKDGIEHLFFVHRLVAKAFLDNPNDLPIINHKDENPSNNKVDNLEWCTVQYNNTYNDRHLKCASKISKSHLGFKASAETKEKLSKIHKGKTPWNKGLKRKINA